MSEVKRYWTHDWYEYDPTDTDLANWELFVPETEYDTALARIATLESDERRRIAGQILAGMYAIKGVGTGSLVVYMTGKQALEIADVAIRKLEDAK